MEEPFKHEDFKREYKKYIRQLVNADLAASGKAEVRLKEEDQKIDLNIIEDFDKWNDHALRMYSRKEALVEEYASQRKDLKVDSKMAEQSFNRLLGTLINLERNHSDRFVDKELSAMHLMNENQKLASKQKLVMSLEADR
ncbi:hypothetical protein CHCC20488_2523 [Bacillus paralicheniformis]|uniref:hypothetical protein n=1 Tax=Bacillus subtilis group TaxID=653685 RepID=UPI0005E583CC|nr:MULTISPECIES: hypothetical protein [Bacillus subtilis group]KJH56471.1 hypothetical protein UF14_14505 [Bacillus licheniformis]MEC2098623.1 hypothetical protein [Bacillus paralicheniformis]MEC2114620.1 hypothetical protein [Bacillus paralicheniformis]MEC2318441.1 hypothetical protein [Bacillus paralicheniformis]TWN44968.1 hypothetical protein CHCC14523_2627 [Bacillus paralicheniformis]